MNESGQCGGGGPGRLGGGREWGVLLFLGWCQLREKIDWQEARKFDCRWCGQFLFFVVPRQFSQGIGEWPENQILIPHWTYFHCPGATLVLVIKSSIVHSFLFFPFLAFPVTRW